MRRAPISARHVALEVIALMVGVITGALALRHAQLRAGRHDSRPTGAGIVRESSVRTHAVRDVRTGDSLTRIGTVVESLSDGTHTWACTCGWEGVACTTSHDAVNDLLRHRADRSECALAGGGL